MRLASFLFWGIMTAAGALVLEIFIPADNFHEALPALSLAFLSTPIIEEFLKLFILGKSLSLEKTGEHNLAKALAFGTGFFSVELGLNLARSNNTLPILPLMGVFLIHLATSGLIGYFLSEETDFSYFRFQNLAIINTVIHLSYNLAVFYYF
jgi:uncharacterized membrane protein